MKVLVMYDSVFGNTERLARIVADEIKGSGHEVECRDQSASGEEDFVGVRLWVLGSPTRWGRPRFRFTTLVKNAVKEAGKDHDFVAFDTKYEKFHTGSADRLHDLLVRNGLRPLMPAQHFFMDGEELRPDQEERARELGRTIVSLL
ncbi:MAG: flavodoxin family protein [Methanomassiliicoccales archaeon]|nr:flavodoxin family protein [Methanomassiliicoccales archaeon]